MSPAPTSTGPSAWPHFSLSERHNVNAGKGYARRFMPGVARIARGVEAVTSRPPRALRPDRLWYSQPISYLNTH